MKKSILLFMAMCGPAMFAQEEILFSSQYRPGMVYHQTISQKAKNITSFLGDATFMEALKEQGQQNPTEEDNTTKASVIVTTGKLTNGKFPVSIAFGNETDLQIPPNTVVFGYCEPGQMPVLDSVSSAGMTNEYKRGFLEGLGSIFKQISFPAKKLKVGESFTDITPLSMPMGVGTVDMDISTTYKLKKIVGNSAHFDVLQVYTMKSGTADSTVKGSGSGGGTLIYDISNGFITNMDSKMNLGIMMDMNNFSLDVKSETDYQQVIKISRNK